MSGILDFLFEGQPPKSVTTTGQTNTTVPQWMQDYSKGILAKANMEAAMPYQPYQGARIAGFNPAQQQSFGLTAANVGSANPGIEAGLGIAGQLPGQGALTQALSYLPGAAEEFPDAAERYMNPYQENVIKRSADLATRNWDEKINPSIQGQFVRNGVYGSSAHEREANRAGRDVTQNIQDTSNAQLAQGWNDSASIFGADQNRKGQLAQVAGQIGATQSSSGLNNASTLANLGTALHTTNAQDAAAMSEVGGQQEAKTQANLDLAHNDFLEQQGYTKDQIAWLNNLLQGSTGTVGKTTDTSNTGPAAKYQPSGLSQIASIIGAWKGIQGINGEET